MLRRDVCFTPLSGHRAAVSACPVRANSGCRGQPCRLPVHEEQTAPAITRMASRGLIDLSQGDPSQLHELSRLLGNETF